MIDFQSVPVIDIGALVRGEPSEKAAKEIREACRASGFFYVVGHGVDEARVRRIEGLFREFFAQDLEQKMQIAMEKAGRAWRGYFPVFGELTSGLPDVKEGIYFGAEHPDDHGRVRAGVPLFGKNLWPEKPALRDEVLAWMADMAKLGRVILRGIASSLALPPDYFDARYLREPTVLFRAFHYPPPPPGHEGWGVGEHTDYGWLTILWQDESGGLQVKSNSRWIEAPPIERSFVCNIGDMLDRMTGGFYKSTPHRVRNTSGRDRLSLPFFYDPDWDAEILPIDTSGAAGMDDSNERWDRENVHAFRGTYSAYLLGKVAKVFPELAHSSSGK